MASQSPPQSSLPPSMGPGARPIQPGESPGSIVREIAQVRSNYSVNVDSENLSLGYELNGNRRQYRLAFDNIPLSGMTKGLCYGGPNTASVTGTLALDMIRATENMAGRPLTQKEAEGFVLHTAKRTMYTYLGNAAGIALGLGFAFKGQKAFKFPFMSPKPMERYDNFPNRYVPVLKGGFARAMWQITRYNVWFACCLLGFAPIARSMGDSVMTVGLYRDTRTHDIVQTVKGNMDRIRGNRPSAGAVNMQGAPSPSPPKSDQYQSDDASSQSFYGGGSDNSSQGDGSAFAGDSTFTDGTTETGVLSDSAVQQREARQTSPSSSSTWNRGTSQSNKQSSSSQSSSQTSSSSGFFFDDASPTAGNDVAMSTPSTYRNPRSGGGSAWDRIRRGGSAPDQGSSSSRSDSSAPAQPPRRGRQDDFETKSDSFSFSRDDEDRSFAKEQAQKEFDSMLERERRESGSGEYDKNMRDTQVGNASETAGGSSSAWDRRRK